MRKHLKHSLIWTIVMTYMLGLAAPAALAAAPSAAPAAQSNPADSGQALEIAPPVIYLSANPGQTITTQLYIRDISSGDLIVSGQVNDFVAAGEDGAPKVLLDTSANNPYTLRPWAAPITSMLLVPHQIKTLSVTFHVPANASPGGHYGVIRFTATPPSLAGTGVSLSASLGALVLMTVSGKINEQLSVKSFSVNHDGKAGSLFQSGPLNFVQELHNSGNIHEQPTGLVTVTDMFGHKLATLPVNQQSSNILPASVRKFSETMDKSVIGNKKLFGHYHANLKVTYGASKKVLTTTLAFWVIPYRLIIVIIILIVIGFFVLRAVLKRYNRRVIERAERSRRHE